MDTEGAQAAADGEERNDAGTGTASSSSSSTYRLFGRQTSIHQMMGGGQGSNCIIIIIVISIIAISIMLLFQITYVFFNFILVLRC